MANEIPDHDRQIVSIYERDVDRDEDDELDDAADEDLWREEWED